MYAEDPSSAKKRRGAHMSNLSCSVADDYNVNIDQAETVLQLLAKTGVHGNVSVAEADKH